MITKQCALWNQVLTEEDLGSWRIERQRKKKGARSEFSRTRLSQIARCSRKNRWYAWLYVYPQFGADVGLPTKSIKYAHWLRELSTPGQCAISGRWGILGKRALFGFSKNFSVGLLTINWYVSQILSRVFPAGLIIPASFQFRIPKQTLVIVIVLLILQMIFKHCVFHENGIRK